MSSGWQSTLPAPGPGKIFYGGLELGGTTIKVCIAENSPTNVVFQKDFPTQDPDSTLQVAYDILSKVPIVSLGIGSFGPVDLDKNSKTYGYITSTPKPKWGNTPVVPRFQSLGVPIESTTDVNAAAMGEIAYGQHGNIRNACYITVGTGIGAGVVVDGNPVTGLLHPEAGHIRVPRYPGDSYEGTCPYHKDCCEGMANAGNIAGRLGKTPKELASVPDSDQVWDVEAFYLAQLCSSLLLIASPEVIVLGGGVLKRKILYPKIRQHLKALLNGYIHVPKILENIDSYIVESIFDQEGSPTSSGCVGVLTLSKYAYDQSQQSSRVSSRL